MAPRGEDCYNVHFTDGETEVQKFQPLDTRSPSQGVADRGQDTGWEGGSGGSLAEDGGASGPPVPLSPVPQLPGAPQASRWAGHCAALQQRQEELKWKTTWLNAMSPPRSERENITGQGHPGKASWRIGSEQSGIWAQTSTPPGPSHGGPYSASSPADGRGSPGSRGESSRVHGVPLLSFSAVVGGRALGMLPTVKALIGLNERVVVHLV